MFRFVSSLTDAEFLMAAAVLAAAVFALTGAGLYVFAPVPHLSPVAVVTPSPTSRHATGLATRRHRPPSTVPPVATLPAAVPSLATAPAAPVTRRGAGSRGGTTRTPAGPTPAPTPTVTVTVQPSPSPQPTMSAPPPSSPPPSPTPSGPPASTLVSSPAATVTP